MDLPHELSKQLKEQFARRALTQKHMKRISDKLKNMTPLEIQVAVNKDAFGVNSFGKDPELILLHLMLATQVKGHELASYYRDVLKYTYEDAQASNDALHDMCHEIFNQALGKGGT